MADESDVPEASEDDLAWVAKTIDYLNAVRARGEPNRAPFSEEESEALGVYASAEIGAVSLEQLDSHIGPSVRLASDLEWQVAGTIAILAGAEEPLEYIDGIMGIKPRERTAMMRRFVGPNVHWVTLVNEIEKVAEARNVIAHGTWDFFQRDPDLRFGWFVSIVKKHRKDKPYKVRTEEWTDEMFVRLRKTTNLLIFMCQMIEFMAMGSYFAHGTAAHPPDLNKATRFHASGFRPDMPDEELAILDELFPPLGE